MKLVLPTDCGNAPRIAIVGEFVTNWAKRDAEAMTAWLTDDVTWTVAGRETASDVVPADFACSGSTPNYLEVNTIITHGRLASCDGFVDSESGRMHFSHVFKFASTSKTAKIREARTYLNECPYENPLYMAEDAGAADLIASGRLQLGISRGSPEQVIDGSRYFGYAPPEGETDADMARRTTEVFLQAIDGALFAQPNPRPMFPNPHPGPLGIEPQSPGLRDRIWWGAGSNATAVWAAQQRMQLMSSTLKNDENGKPFHVQQAEQIEAYRAAWREAGHPGEPRVSVSRSIFALTSDTDRAYFGGDRSSTDQIGNIDATTRAIFGRSYAAEPDVLIEELAQDEAIAAAETVLLTVPNQLGVDYNAHVLESILTHVAPGLGWR